MTNSLDNIFGDTQEDKVKNPATSQSRTVSADPLENIFANSPKPTVKQVQVQSPTQEKTDAGLFDKAVSFVGKVATGIGDWVNKQQQKNAEASFNVNQLMSGKATVKTDESGQKFVSTPELDAYRGAKTQEEKATIIEADQANTPVIKFLNSEAGKNITGSVYNSTSNVPLKLIAGFKAIGDDTYDEAYSALVAKSKDPNNTRFEKIMYGLQDSGVQSAIGALLATGVTYLTKNPTAGRAVSLAYFAPISAESQRRDKGKVTSVGNIAIDTVGDTIISGFAESALKSFIKEGGEAGVKAFAKQLGKGFLVEGGTEPAQTFIKYANDYRNAKTDAEKKKIVADVTKYVKDGGMVDEFLIGGLSGAGITGVAAGAGKALGADIKVDPSLQSGGTVEATKGTVKGELNIDFSKVRDEIPTLQAELTKNPNNKEVLKQLSVAQDQLNDYNNAVKERAVYVSSDTQEAPLAVVETVQYPDGKYTYRFSADTQSNSINSPFISSETFASKEEAIKAGKEQVLAWAKSKAETAEPAELAKIKEIEQEINTPTNVSAVKVSQETQTKTTELKPQIEKEAVVVQSNTQVNPNVEKTRAGVYRVTQYSQKGEAQGKAEARFVRSKKTGKLYFEVNKDGKRIGRMSLEQAKKKFNTTDRPTMVERAVNGKFNKNTGNFDMRQSNSPVINNNSQNSVEKKPIKTKGEVRNSSAFQRVQSRLGEYADIDVNYNRLNLADDTAKAMEFVEKNPKEAKKIALGLMGAPEGVTETAISIALAEQASQSKDYALQAQLERSRSLRQTRRGQEIVAERGRFNENSPHFFMQQVLAARLENAGKTKFKFFTKSKNETVSRTAESKMKEGSEAIKQTIKKKLTAADLAQSVIDELTC